MANEHKLNKLFTFSQILTVTVTNSFLQHGGSDIKWVDGGKPLFKVSTFVVSTVNTQVSAFFSDTQSDKETPMCPG
jgi:hypothetical protein